MVKNENIVYNISKYLVCATGVNVENHEGAHMVNAVRLGKVFDLLIKYFFYFQVKKG